MKVKDTDMKNIWKLNLKNKLKKEECAGKPVFQNAYSSFGFIVISVQVYLNQLVLIPLMRHSLKVGLSSLQ